MSPIRALRGTARPRSAAPRTAPRPRVAGLERPLDRYLVELEPEPAEGRSWYGEPGPRSCSSGRRWSNRAGVSRHPVRVTQAYLELAVLVRALEGLGRGSVRHGARPLVALAGLFDLRENLLGRAVDDLRAPAA